MRRGRGFRFDWSPDRTTLIAFPSEALGHAVLIDPVDGTSRVLEHIGHEPADAGVAAEGSLTAPRH